MTHKNKHNMPLSDAIRARIRYQHQAITEIIAGLSEERLKQRINPDKWSAFENIAHLTAYQPMFIKRLERIQQESAPVFERYVAEKDPLFPGYLDKPLAALLSEIDARRGTIIAILEAMDEATLQRTGVHPRYGTLSIPQWTEFFLLHEAHHLFTTFILVQELRTSGS